MTLRGLPLLTLLLLAARLEAQCPGGCLKEGDGGPPEEGCAETGGCLRKEGQLCGVYLAHCASGLQCRPPDDELPLQALLQGRGRCRRVRGPSAAGENPKEGRPRPGTTRLQDGHRRDPQRHPGVSLTRPSSGGIPDSEMGPCRKHLDLVLQQLQTEVYRGSHTLYVPNCDHRGFYRKRQCRSSQGQRRGPCWCVDRMGAPDSDGCGGSAGTAGSSG